MDYRDKIEFLSVLELVGEQEIRHHLEAGHYRAKKRQDRLSVTLRWLERQPWRRAAWLN